MKHTSNILILTKTSLPPIQLTPLNDELHLITWNAFSFNTFAFNTTMISNQDLVTYSQTPPTYIYIKDQTYCH